MLIVNELAVALILIFALFGNGVLPVQTQPNQSDLEYLNQDLSPTDGVVLRPNETEMGKAYMASSNSAIPKYNPIVDIKTCTKRKIYSLFYDIVNHPNSLDNFSTSNAFLKNQANTFYKETNRISSTRNRNSIEYTTLNYTLNNTDTADVEILLTSNIFFYKNNNSYLQKEKVNFQIEYQNSKCQITQTNFFEKVLKDEQGDSKAKIIFAVIFIAIFVIVVIPILLVGRFLWQVIFKKNK